MKEQSPLLPWNLKIALKALFQRFFKIFSLYPIPYPLKPDT